MDIIYSFTKSGPSFLELHLKQLLRVVFFYRLLLPTAFQKHIRRTKMVTSGGLSENNLSR